jgi:hypothetical protein
MCAKISTTRELKSACLKMFRTGNRHPRQGRSRYADVCVCVRVCTQQLRPQYFVNGCVCVCVCVCVCIQMDSTTGSTALVCAYMYICKSKYIHTYIHTHIYIYTGQRDSQRNISGVFRAQRSVQPRPRFSKSGTRPSVTLLCKPRENHRAKI